MKKIIALLIAGIMTVSMCACGSKKDDGKNDSAKAGVTDSLGNVIDLELDYKNKKLADGVVAVVDGVEITKEELRFMLAQTIANYSMQQGIEQAENAERDKLYDEITEESTMTLREQFFSYSMATLITSAVFANLGIKENIDFTDEEVKTKCDELGITESYDILKNQFELTQESMDSVWRKQFIYEQYATNNLQNNKRLNPDDEMLKKYFNEDFIKAQHILKLTQDQTTGEAFDEGKKAEVKAAAEAILAELRGGADFDTLMSEESEDPGSAQQPEGYVFTEGEMVTEFYEGAKALKEGEISGLVETSYGYHIIKRIPFADGDFDANKEKVASSYKNAESQKIMKEFLDEAEVVIDYNQVLKTDDVLYKKTTLMEALQAMQEAAQPEEVPSEEAVEPETAE